MTSATAVTELELPLKKLGSGKVREIFEIDVDRLLFVATDRISAFDVILNQGIPDKGRVLTLISLFWFQLLADICPHHLISASQKDLPEQVADRQELDGRFMIVSRLNMLPVEFVVRGYLVGSGWKDYEKNGSVCGILLPKGLREAEKLDEPVFTPATKAASGHDQNISEDEAAELCGPDKLKAARDSAIELYVKARDHAETKGIILADTKFEFGTNGDQVVLADEVLTPDSSRFWPKVAWRPGINPPSLDKQFVRDWLESIGWDHEPPAPALPYEVIDQTRAKYVEAYENLTSKQFPYPNG